MLVSASVNSYLYFSIPIYLYFFYFLCLVCINKCTSKIKVGTPIVIVLQSPFLNARRYAGSLTTQPHHTTLLMDALNAAPMCNDVCDVVMVGNTVMCESRLNI